MKIGTLQVGPDQPCRVVAEISGNHNQDYQRARRLIKAAKDAGADAVKFQCFTIPEILALRGDGQAPAPWDQYTKRELYEQNQTPLEWFPALFAAARDVGLPAFSTVMGAESFACLEAVGCPAYKIAAAEMGNVWLRELAESSGKPLIRSSGRMTAPPHPYDHLTLYCPPGYPVADFHLGAMRRGRYEGISLHSRNGYAACLGVAAGAQAIEVHLMLDDGQSCLDEAFSYRPDELATLIHGIRDTEALLA